jgi:hypothetical protein
VEGVFETSFGRELGHNNDFAGHYDCNYYQGFIELKRSVSVHFRKPALILQGDLGMKKDLPE